MKRNFLLILFVFGMPAASLAQAAASDSQTLQALLTEVRELRQDLRISLARVQSTQVLLFRLQIEQDAVARASKRLDDAHAMLAGAQEHQKHVAADLKRMEDALNAEENLVRQKELRDTINRLKSEQEDSTELQQRQAAEIESEQQMRAEQEKLAALETQLDELVRKLGNPGEPSRAGR